MAKTLQFRRGTTTELSTIAGAVGELFVDTTKDTVVVMDGSTAGGFPLAKESDVTALTSSISGKANTSDVNTALAGKQATLVSGTNIKTVNGTSILGSGNIAIAGGGGDLTQVASDITPSFSEVYDIGSETQRFYDAYLANKLDIDGTTVIGNSTLISAAIAGSPETTTSAPVTANFANFANGQCYVMGSSLYISESGTNNGWAAWANTHWNTNQLIGATITCTSLPGTEAPFTTTITGFFGSAPNYGFSIANSQSFGSHITEVSITYNSTVVVPAVTAVPAVWDRTLSTNASLIAPEVLVDTALLGDLHVEGSTITPSHILGEYSDVKGTVVLDGSLKINNDLNVRNNITLQQEVVEFAKVISKSVVAPYSQTNSYRSSNNTWSTTDIQRLYFNGSFCYVYTQSGNSINNTVLSMFTSGNTVNFEFNGWTWVLQITSSLTSGNGSSFTFSVSSQTSGYAYPGDYNSNYWYYDNGIGLSQTVQIPENTVLSLDRSAVQPSEADFILVNGQYNTPPVSTTGNVSATSFNQGHVSVGNGRFDGYAMMPMPISSAYNDAFTVGNTVTFSNGSQTATGVVTGRDWINAGDTSYCTVYLNFTTYNSTDFYIGTWYTGSGTISYTGSSYTPYNTIYSALTVSGHTVQGTSTSLSSINIGDTFSYIPSSTSLTFKKNDGSLVKAISYDNSSGVLTYAGIPESIIKLASNGNIISTNAYGVGNPSDGNSVEATNNGGGAIAIGAGTTTQANSVSLGNNASSAGNGVAIGYNVRSGYQGIAIGSNPNANSNGDGAIGIGYNTNGLSYKSIALGYQANQYVDTTYPYYTVPGLRSTYNTRDVTFGVNTNFAVPYLYVGYPGNSVSASTSAQSFLLSAFLNFAATPTLITLEYLIHTNGTNDYWGSGVRRYMYNPNLSTNRLVTLAGTLTSYGTYTYSNVLSVDFVNNSSQQQLKVTTNASDTTNKYITVKISASLYV